MAVLAHEGTYPIMYGRLAVPVGAGYRPGYLARPDKVGVFPIVVIVPGLNGLTPTERDLCRRFARRGLAALSVDLYEQPAGGSLDRYASLADRRAMTLLDEVAEFLASDDVDWAHAGAVGLMGIDVGGRYALALASQRPWVGSAVACYAPLTGDEGRDLQVADLLGHIPVPVLGIYGADDDLIDSTSVDEAQRRNEAGQWLLYTGAGHGFLDIGDPNYADAAAADAEERIIQFFLATLPAPETVELG